MHDIHNLATSKTATGINALYENPAIQDQFLRQHCLELALTGNYEVPVEQAGRFFDFIKGAGSGAAPDTRQPPETDSGPLNMWADKLFPGGTSMKWGGAIATLELGAQELERAGDPTMRERILEQQEAAAFLRDHVQAMADVEANRKHFDPGQGMTDCPPPNSAQSHPPFTVSHALWLARPAGESHQVTVGFATEAEADAFAESLKRFPGTARPNAFDACVEPAAKPATEPRMSLHIVEKLVNAAVKGEIRQGEYKEGPLSVRSTVTELDHGTACEIHVDVQYQFTGYNFKVNVSTQ